MQTHGKSGAMLQPPRAYISCEVFRADFIILNYFFIIFTMKLTNLKFQFIIFLVVRHLEARPVDASTQPPPGSPRQRSPALGPRP